MPAAGRDGLPSECLLLYSDGDFSKYAGDFYLGTLPANARRAALRSTEALRAK